MSHHVARSTDPRSANLNTELGFVIENRPLAAFTTGSSASLPPAPTRCGFHPQGNSTGSSEASARWCGTTASRAPPACSAPRFRRSRCCRSRGCCSAKRDGWMYGIPGPRSFDLLRHRRSLVLYAGCRTDYIRWRRNVHGNRCTDHGRSGRGGW